MDIWMTYEPNEEIWAAFDVDDRIDSECLNGDISMVEQDPTYIIMVYFVDPTECNVM